MNLESKKSLGKAFKRSKTLPFCFYKVCEIDMEDSSGEIFVIMLHRFEPLVLKCCCL